ncbi:MBOAT family O-acyltransferase [Hyalangium versicolor]|uniref:MBOAT family O-acyltransferase n=1 Tax=Hyalangium versicolor TaxID=2861190 RepID=UPI001CCC189B|nr:MBOAT family O-acyltransferase [Hyalangium versicolor]
MLFNTVLFWLFFAAFFVAFHFVARTRVTKLWLVVVGSLLFYGAWDLRCVPLLLGTALLDFWIALLLSRSDDERKRRALLAVSIVANLGVLGFFKYARFFADSAHGLLGVLGVSLPEPTFSLLLPAGISFYTFQSMSYTIDVYRRELTARERPEEFLAAVSFFPHLVAGPIIRASVLLPQFEKMEAPRWEQARRGYLLIAVGLFKKTVADLLAAPSDSLFQASGASSALEAWTGALAFTGQIYADFSGYTDIAIGVALLLGFVLPPNFDLPYLATSPIDFWRRWHLSLSTWLRDYLYIPLGGNRNGRYRNLLLTMLLGGLWHGANWTFVLWGLYHGLLLVAAHLLVGRFPALKQTPSAAVLWLKRLGTFYLVVLGWVLFRAENVSSALRVLRGMHAPAEPSSFTWPAVLSLLFVLMGLVLCHAASALAEKTELRQRPFALWPVVATCLAVAMAVGMPGHSFIYFQF